MKATYIVKAETNDKKIIEELLTEIGEKRYLKNEEEEYGKNGDIVSTIVEIFDDNNKLIKRIEWKKEQTI